MGIIYFIIIILILISIHEFGHFIFAKLFNVYVTEFALGFGPKIFSKKGKETEFSIRLLPIGGFAAMVGEDGEIAEELAHIPYDRTVKGVNRFKQFWIMFGGVFFNLILGFILFCIVALTSPNITTKPIVGHVEDNSPAYVAGLRTNDYVKEIIINNEAKVIDSYSELQFIVSKNTEGKSYQLIVNRDNKDYTLDIQPKYNEEAKSYLAGYSPLIIPPSTNPLTILKNGLDYSIGACGDVFLSLRLLISGQAKLDDVSGPVGMVNLTSQIENSSGILGLIKFTGLLSINLAVFNLLPIPALDGGRILIIIIESISRRKLHPKIESGIIGGSFILLLGLIAIVTLNDITKFFR